MRKKIWLLPEGVEDFFPARAHQIEAIREKLSHHLQKWGYEPVIPSMFESLESLSVTGNSELIDHSFKLTDPVSGKIIALRVDMTTQVARIDARSNSTKVARFFYVGPIFRGKNKHYKNSRTPIQFGAEIYGHAGIESDVEIVEMMLDLLSQCGYQNLVLDISHAGCLHKILDSFLKTSDINSKDLLQAIKQKSLPDLKNLLGDSVLYQDLVELLTLIGDERILSELNQRFPKLKSEIKQLQSLIELIEGNLAKRHSSIQLNWHIDLSNLQNYRYHNGLIFNVIDAENNTYLAKGGRYDNIGEPFGISRPATGFSMFIDQLKDSNQTNPIRIFITTAAQNHPKLLSKLNQIEQQFQKNNTPLQFIRALSNQDSAASFDCQYKLGLINNELELTQ